MDITIEISERAQAVIESMGNAVRTVRGDLGENDALYAKSAASLSLSLIQMLNLKPTHINADGDLSLICTGGPIVFGVNVHYQTVVAYGMEYKVPTWSVNS